MASIFRRMIITLTLASLPCVVPAAGSLAGETMQPNGADQAMPYDCGNAYFAPGSYSSWFYVAPPICEDGAPASETAKPVPGPTALNLPEFYDFDARWGPLYG